MWPFRAKVAKQGVYLIEQVRINGVPCKSTKALKELLSWIDVTEHLSRLAAAWAPYWQVSPGLFTFQVAAYQDIQTLLSEICGLQDLIESVTSIIAPPGSLAGPAWSDVEVLQQLVQAAEAVKGEESFTEIQREVNEYESSMHRHAFIHQAPPAMTALWEAVKARSEAQYAAAYEQLIVIVKMQETLRLREALFARLEVGARALASALRKNQADAVWDSRLGHFTAAWNWGRAERWLSHRSRY